MIRRLGSVIGLLLFWELLRHIPLVDFSNVPSPVAVADAATEYLGQRQFYSDLAASASRVALGFGAAIATAVPLGLFIGWYRPIFDLLFPALELLRPIPPIAWAPLALIVLPSEPASVAFITFLGAFFPILIHTIDGAMGVDGLYKRAASSLGAGRRQLLVHVVWPATLPSIVAGLSIGLGIAWMNLVAAEMIAGGAGLGYRTWEAFLQAAYPKVVFEMIAIGLAGYLSTALVRQAGIRLLPWTHGVRNAGDTMEWRGIA